MYRFLALLAIVVALYSTTYAQTSPSCAQVPNLACASGTPSTQDVVTTWNFKTGSANEFTLDGATGDTNKITVALAGDPAGSFTATIPHDGASAMAKAVTCSGGQHVSSFSATTGTLSCTADTGGAPAWDSITSPTSSNLSLSMAARTTTFTWGNATGAGTNMFSVLDTTSNSGTGYVMSISTAASSAAKPISITAGGLSNGVEMTTAGLLQAKGTGGIKATSVTTGALASALTWNESCTSSPCTLAATPRTADTALVFWRTLKLRRVVACGGINEYTLSGTTLTMCSGTLGAGADSLQITYEL